MRWRKVWWSPGHMAAHRLQVLCWRLQHKPHAVFFNDAGIGKDDAGIAALALMQEVGVIAAVYAHTSARIGDANDGWCNGIITRCNALAQKAGALLHTKRCIRWWITWWFKGAAKGWCSSHSTRTVLGKLLSEHTKVARVQCIAHFLHQVQVVMQVVNRGQHGAEHFAATV